MKTKPSPVSKARRGDIWWANVFPMVAKYRPVLVVSNDDFNEGDGVIVIPMSSQYADRTDQDILVSLSEVQPAYGFLMRDRCGFVNYALWLDASQSWHYPFRSKIGNIRDTEAMRSVDRFLCQLFGIDIDQIM